MGACSLVAVGAGAFFLFETGAKRPAGQVGGPFDLIDADGVPYTFADMLGKPSLVYFGFTRCPDICPTSLFLLSQVIVRLGADADRINALFITVDPDRDTPAQMKAYLSAFDPHLRGLTGDRAHLAVAWDIFGVESEVVPTSSDNYNMSHTSKIFVLDRNGFFVNEFDMATSPADATALIQPFLG